MGKLSKPEDHIVAVRALCGKRAEVAMQIAESERRTDQLRAELVHIDAVLRLFKPSLDPNDIPARKRRHVRSDYFAHGEISRRAYDAMRDGKIVAGVDIAAVAIRDKGLDPENDRPLAPISCAGSRCNSARCTGTAQSRRSGAGAACGGSLRCASRG